MSHANTNEHDDADTNGNEVERYAGGFIKGMLKVVGYTVLAVVGGYAAGVALDNCQVKRSKGGYHPANAAH